MAKLTALTLYPIKSCAGIALSEASLTLAGLQHAGVRDREWMLVTPEGQFITQRECPKMALITPRIVANFLEVRAPGMALLRLPLGGTEVSTEVSTDASVMTTCQVQIWDDSVSAHTAENATSTTDWFSTAVGTPCKLVRALPLAQRAGSAKWVGAAQAPTHFADGYPFVLIGQASLDDLNDKLRAQGREALPMNRFRPNLVIDDSPAFEEDYTSALRVGAAVLKPVKPCPRCTMPSIDQLTGEIGPDPLDILRGYRTDPRLDDAITFGMNAILLAGDGVQIKLGQEVSMDLAF